MKKQFSKDPRVKHQYSKDLNAPVAKRPMKRLPTKDDTSGRDSLGRKYGDDPDVQFGYGYNPWNINFTD